MKILNLFSSISGNTEKVARTIHEAIQELGDHEVDTVKITKDVDVDILHYDFIFAGSGVYIGQPDNRMKTFLSSLKGKGKKELLVKPAAPRLPSRFTVVYCTYSGFHTGINEAIPCTKLLGQYFDHYGYTVIDEWYIVGSFVPKNKQSNNLNGRYGDIRNRPNASDLKEVYEKTKGTLRSVA